MMASHGAEQLDEGFLQALYEGSDLLGKGHLQEAMAALERALEVKPGDAKARNLLGLTAFKLGRHDLALELYEALIHENPTDPTLRVNLGLVLLKTGQAEQAARQLTAAVDLAPDHRRAHNYLGLALAKLGEYAQARACFVAAGSDQMVARMDAHLAGEGGVRAPGGVPAASPGPAPSPAPGAPPPADDAMDLGEQEPAGAARPSATPEPAPAPAPRAPAAPDPAAQPEPRPEPAAPEPAPTVVAPPAPAPAPIPASRWLGARHLLELAEAREVEEPPEAPFAVGEDLIVAGVEGQLHARLRGLVAVEGEVSLEPEVKRFRGRATDRAFGEGDGRMFRLTGHGRVLLARRDRVFTAVEVLGADGYFHEPAVAGFQEGVEFENGRVPSRISRDLHLVHLKGEGAVLLETDGPVRSLQVEADRPARVPLPRLVGWHGALTPHLQPLVADEAVAAGLPVVVELAGEGVVLVSLPEES